MFAVSGSHDSPTRRTFIGWMEEVKYRYDGRGCNATPHILFLSRLLWATHHHHRSRPGLSQRPQNHQRRPKFVAEIYNFRSKHTRLWWRWSRVSEPVLYRTGTGRALVAGLLWSSLVSYRKKLFKSINLQSEHQHCACGGIDNGL